MKGFMVRSSIEHIKDNGGRLYMAYGPNIMVHVILKVERALRLPAGAAEATLRLASDDLALLQPPLGF